jgi:hypothetical protein
MPFDPEVVAFRRAALAILIQAARPVSLHEMAAALAVDFGERRSPKQLSDLMRYQMRCGRVRRAGRGLYTYVPGSLSKSTEWRCANWRLELARALEPWAS